MATPGKIVRCGASNRCDRPASSIVPQLGVGGWTPRPRKLSDASAIIAPAMPSVAWTMTEGNAVGSTCRTTIRAERAPSARAACTYSSSRARSTCPRTRRAYPTHPITHSARMTFVRPGPRTATSAIASRMPGNAIRMSIARLIRSSTAPPK